MYAKLIGTSVFTPQLIVDGARSEVGSNESAVIDVIQTTARDMMIIPMTLTPDKTGKQLLLHIGMVKSKAPEASVYAVRFKRNSATDVKAGENSGRNLHSINSVIEMHKLGSWQNKAEDLPVMWDNVADEGLVVLLQTAEQGRIIGALSYNTN